MLLLARDSHTSIRHIGPVLADLWQDWTFTYKMKSFDDFYKQLKEEHLFRPVAGSEYTDKNPVILMGCSFAYGHILPDEAILSAKLSEKLKRTVYNFGYPGWGTQQILYIMQNDNDMKNIKMNENDKQYIIYWHISDHFRRLYSPFWSTNKYYFLTYKEKNNTLEKVNPKHPIIDSYYPYKTWKTNSIDKKAVSMSIEEKYRFFNLHLKEIMKEKNKLFPKAEFILLSTGHFSEEENDIIKSLGIKLINIEDLTGMDLENDYDLLDETGHPEASAVECLSKYLAKELNK